MKLIYSHYFISSSSYYFLTLSIRAKSGFSGDDERKHTESLTRSVLFLFLSPITRFSNFPLLFTGLIMWFPAGVIPYLPYSKQSKMNKRGSIPSKLVASLMCRAGMVLHAILTWVIHYGLLPFVRAHCMSPVLKSGSVSCSLLLLLLLFFARLLVTKFGSSVLAS